MKILDTKIIRHPELSWRTRILSFLIGVLVVLFFVLISGALQESTDVVDLFDPLITALRMAAVGLGTGHYLGISLQQEETGERWFFFGIFATLATIALLTVDTLLYGQIPAFVLLLIGAIIPILAHFNPVVQNNDGYIDLLKVIGGYLSTSIVVLFAISEYIFTLINRIAIWFSSLPLGPQFAVIVFFLGISYVANALTVDIRKKKIKREVKREMKREVADKVVEMKKEELQEKRDDHIDVAESVFDSVGIDIDNVEEDDESDNS